MLLGRQSWLRSISFLRTITKVMKHKAKQAKERFIDDQCIRDRVREFLYPTGGYAEGNWNLGGNHRTNGGLALGRCMGYSGRLGREVFNERASQAPVTSTSSKKVNLELATRTAHEAPSPDAGKNPASVSPRTLGRSGALKHIHVINLPRNQTNMLQARSSLLAEREAP